MEKVRPRLPANASLDFVATNATDADAAQDDNYLKPLTEQGEPFDLIIRTIWKPSPTGSMSDVPWDSNPQPTG